MNVFQATHPQNNVSLEKLSKLCRCPLQDLKEYEKAKKLKVFRGHAPNSRYPLEYVSRADACRFVDWYNETLKEEAELAAVSHNAKVDQAVDYESRNREAHNVYLTAASRNRRAIMEGKK